MMYVLTKIFNKNEVSCSTNYKKKTSVQLLCKTEVKNPVEWFDDRDNLFLNLVKNCLAFC